MVQFSIVPGGSLAVLESAVAGAARFAEAVRSVPSSRAVSAQADGTTVSNDRQLVVESGRFAAEANARSAGAANASAGASLLQTADEALAEIGTKLDQMANLAEAAQSSDRSSTERAKFNAEFQSLKADIDTIAQTTTFNGTALLQGGDGPGGVLELSFKVGAGSGDSDSIVVQIAPASVADLSSGLTGDTIQTEADAVTTADDVATAQDAVGSIRAGIAGGIQRFAAAAQNNRVMEKGFESSVSRLTSPTITVDMAKLLATRIAKDGGISLSDRAIEQIQQLLISLDLPEAPPVSQDSQATTKDGADATTGGSKASDEASGSNQIVQG